MKNKKRISILLGTVLVAVVFISGYYLVMAATYFWTQEAWTTESTDVAVHNTHNNNWNKYSEKSSNAELTEVVDGKNKITITQETDDETHSSYNDFHDDEASRTGIELEGSGDPESLPAGRLKLIMP